MMRCLIYIRIALLLVLIISQSAHASRKRRLGEHCSFFLANLQSAADTASGKRPFYELIEKEPFEYRSEHFKTVEGVPSSALGPGLSKPDYLAHYYSHNQNGVPVEVSIRRE